MLPGNVRIVIKPLHKFPSPNDILFSWFEYMGSVDNGYSPFDILYVFSEVNIVDGDDTYYPHNPTTTACNEPVESQVIESCLYGISSAR